MSAPKDILYIIPRPEIGGAERQLLMLIQNLDRTQFRPHVVCLDGGGSLLDDYQKAAENVCVLNRRKPIDLKTFVTLVRLIHQLRPALVHTWLYISNLYGGWAARLAGVPAVVVAHRGLCIDPRHSRFKACQMKFFNGFIAQFADRLLVNAKAVAQAMWDVGFHPQQTQVIYNGLHTNVHVSKSQQSDLRAELKVQKDQILLGSITKVDTKKDLETMFRATAKVAEKYNVRLLVIGGGDPSYQKSLETLAEDLAIDDRIDFLGFRPDPQAVLSLCNLSLLSSVTEGLPNAILESMVLGKPVVATEVGGVSELIQNGVHGHLVPSGDADAFADRILDLLDHPEHAEKMGAEGRVRARTQFSVTAMVRNIEAVYIELLSPQTGHSFVPQLIASSPSKIKAYQAAG